MSYNVSLMRNFWFFHCVEDVEPRTIPQIGKAPERWTSSRLVQALVSLVSYRKLSAPHCVNSTSRSSGVDFKEFGTFTSSTFNRLDWNNAKLIPMYIAVNKSPAYVGPHDMPVTCSMTKLS
jgi:hypothetical protein